MITIKRHSIILSIIVLTIIFSSFYLFIRLFHSDNLTLIYTYSYGKGTTFEFLRIEDVSNVRVSTHMESEQVTFRVPDKDYFIETYVFNHPNFVTSYELYTNLGGYYRTFYIFEYENHLFSMYYYENSDVFLLTHVGAYVGGLYIPFPAENFFYNNYNQGNIIKWEDMWWEPWNSFEDAAMFYESLNAIPVMIDYDQKTIKLNGLRFIERSPFFTTNYPVTLIFDDDGFSIEYDSTLD